MKILLIEENLLLQKSIREILSKTVSKSEIICLNTGAATKTFLSHEQDINLFLISIELSDVNSIKLIQEIRGIESKAPIIVLNKIYSRFLIEKLKRLDISAYISYLDNEDTYVKAIQSVLNKKVFISKNIHDESRKLVNETAYIEKNKIDFITQKKITERELEIINLMMTSKTNKEIADELFLSSDTIKFHRKNIYKKTGVGNILELYKLLVEQHFFIN